MACMVDLWVEKRGVDRQVVVVVGVHGGFVGEEARCRPPSGGRGGRAWWICGWRCVNCYHDRRSAQTWFRDGYLISWEATRSVASRGTATPATAAQQRRSQLQRLQTPATVTATQQAHGKTPRARQAMLNRARLPPQERLPPQGCHRRARLTSSSQTSSARTRTSSTGGEDGERSPCMFKHVCSNPGDTRTISMAACATMDDISIARWQASRK
jgi:hypothetical protein